MFRTRWLEPVPAGHSEGPGSPGYSTTVIQRTAPAGNIVLVKQVLDPQADQPAGVSTLQVKKDFHYGGIVRQVVRLRLKILVVYGSRIRCQGPPRPLQAIAEMISVGDRDIGKGLRSRSQLLTIQRTLHDTIDDGPGIYHTWPLVAVDLDRVVGKIAGEKVPTWKSS